MSTSMWLRQLRSRLFSLGTRNNRRKAASAAAHRRVRPCLEPLEDRLVLDAVQTVVTPSPITAPYSESSQTVTLKADLTDHTAGTPVTEGKVTFTVVNPSNSQTIGTATGAVHSSSKGGQASGTFTLPAFTNVGSYTIDVAYTDNGGPNTDGGDTPGTLAVTAASTTTTAQNATTTFSTSAQHVTLDATVTSSAGTVDEGKVKFTLVNSTGKTVGSAASGSVTSKGSASASYGLPAFTNVGSYTIKASYTDSKGNFANSDNATQSPAPALSVTAASTKTTASDAFTTFSTSPQNVALTANVTSSAGTVDEGKVKFTLVNSTGKTVGSAASGSVTSHGSASVNYGLPAFTNVGTYTIEASYKDSKGNFGTSSDNAHSLAVNAASTTTTASSTSTSFSTGPQNVTLTATVTSSAGPVNEGNVSFTLVDSNGNTIGTATPGNVSNGSASVSYTLPAGTAAGTYTIQASYNDLFGSFASSSDNSHTVTVGAAASTTVSLTSASITPNASGSNAQVTLTAKVSNSGGVVNEGVVTFTLDGVTARGSVSNGTATVTLSVPATNLLTPSHLTLSYSDSAGPGNFVNGNGSAWLTTNFFNATLSANLTYNSDGTVRIDMQMGGQTVLGFVYTSSGLPTEIDVGSLTLPVTYSTVLGNDVLVSIDGTPWQLNMFSSSGQYEGLATLLVNSDGSQSWLILNSSGQTIGALPGS